MSKALMTLNSPRNLNRAVFRLFVGSALGILTANSSRAADVAEYSPAIAGQSDEGELAIQRIRVPDGLKIELFAAEPLLANPVAFTVDERGRFYVVETFRHSEGVTDDRKHMDWLEDDLACRTVADRVAMFKKHLGDQFETFTREHDRVRLIEDTDGDGKADHATVFADGFHNAPDGIGAGLLAREGQVWFTCIPDLWLLADRDGDGRAEDRRSLQHGYGVHVGFLGHDLHGLRMGPDGKLYFSIGDRGLNVETEGRTIALPDTGAVLRSNLDGSDLEVFATGLRNPQELAFDQYGNLFTGDNNSDGGDQARWVHVVEGGDSGWRIGYQFHDKPVSRGPWNAERLWELAWEGQAAYILPPLANLASGPSGLAYYPGVGLPAKYDGHFFLCDFRGSSAKSGVRSLAVRPKGASFEVVDEQEMIWSVLATDVDFGVDGGLYLTDWVEGWDKPGKGRIYRVFEPALVEGAAVQEVKRLIGEGMAGRTVAELVRLLAHADMRVRQEAQFALAKQGTKAIDALAAVAREGSNTLPRLHAIWALGQIGRSRPQALDPVLPLLKDEDDEVRAQAAKVLGDGRLPAAYDGLVSLLADPQPRVRFFAALGLGKLRRREAILPVLAMLSENADQDRYLRHAGVMALTGTGDADALVAASVGASPAARMGILLALRRLESPEVARFLNDPETLLVLEAARAINDVPIEAAQADLALLVTRVGLAEPLLWRALNSNYRLGTAQHADAVAAFAASSDAPENLRIEALGLLETWVSPPGRDRVMGLWRPLGSRPPELAAEAMQRHLPGIFTGPDAVRLAAARLAASFKLPDVGPLLFGLVADPACAPATQVEAIKALEILNDMRLSEAVTLALAAADPRVRAQGQRLLAQTDPDGGIKLLTKVLNEGDVIERQAALATLARLENPAADQVLSNWLDRLLSADVPLEMQLDLLLAAGQRPVHEIQERLARFEQARPSSDSLSSHRETLAGGDADRGAKLFFDRAEVSCQRCHKVRGRGGEVGPELSTIAAKNAREYLLAALVDPSKDIAKGFETTVVVTLDGETVTGIVKEESDRQLRLVTADVKTLTIDKNNIEERARGKSSMPDNVAKLLTKSEIRDLVEFLSSLK